MTDDDTLDFASVAFDDAAVEALRAGAVRGDDDALLLLRDLLDDVTLDLPVAEPITAVTVGRGSTVLPLASESTPERRLVRGSTFVAAVTAGVLSLGGVAAASTLAPAGSALHGIGEAVRSAAGAVVGAVTPPEKAPADAPAVTPPSPAAAVVPPVQQPATNAGPAQPGPAQPAPGRTVSAETRSQAAARQVAGLLDTAERLLDSGRTDAASQRLDLAERKLAEVLPADRADALKARLAALRERAAAAAAPAPAEQPAKVQQQPKQAEPKQQQQQQEPAESESDARPESEDEPESKKDSSAKQDRATRTAPPKGGGKLVDPQLSIDASAYPRA